MPHSPRFSDGPATPLSQLSWHDGPLNPPPLDYASEEEADSMQLMKSEGRGG